MKKTGKHPKVMTVASALFAEAKEKNLPISKAAKLAGIGGATPYRWLDGSQCPMWDKIDAFARVIREYERGK